MPFTPIHMGPGLLIKSLLQGAFSLMVFGWSQIVMDIQPLVVLLTGEGHLHGFSHTYLGASLLAIVSALSGKYLANIGLKFMAIIDKTGAVDWFTAVLSAFIGCFSHVAIDSIMHADLQPFYPWIQNNALLGLVSIERLHKLCLYSGLLGASLYFAIRYLIDRKAPS